MKESCLKHRSWSNTIVMAIVGFGIIPTAALGQAKAHRLHNAYQPPGAVAQNQTQRTDRFQGYVQPIEFRVPKGATVAVSNGGSFEEWESQLRVGLTLGHIYRLKVSNIPENIGGEVYPTVEIINRLHPPEEKTNQFPIPIQMTQRDLEHAIAGRFVVRVIYLENPQNAYPHGEDPQEQRTIGALPEEDPLHLADQLGRPMAILRMGSRKPDTNGVTDEFMFGSPPVIYLSTATPYSGNAIPSSEPVSSESATTKTDTYFELTPKGELDATPSEIEIQSDAIPKQDTFPNLNEGRDGSLPVLETSLLNKPIQNLKR